MKLELGQKLFAIKRCTLGARPSVEQVEIEGILTEKTGTTYQDGLSKTLAWTEDGKLKLASHIYFTEKQAKKNLRPFIEEEILNIKQTIKYHEEKLKPYKKELKSLKKITNKQ